MLWLQLSWAGLTAPVAAADGGGGGVSLYLVGSDAGVGASSALLIVHCVYGGHPEQA